MNFPLATFDTDVDNRWDSIFRFAESMYGICRPSLAHERVDLVGVPAMPKSFHKWLALSRNLSTAVGFHFFDFEPKYDEAFAHIAIANFNQFGLWGINLSEIGSDDPPVGAFQFVRSQNKFVPRKLSRVNSLTQWVLELLIDYGCINHIGTTLNSPARFVKELQKHSVVTERIGNIFLTGSTDWYATVSAGAGPFGSGKCVILRYKDTTDQTRIPQFLKDAVGLRSQNSSIG